MLPTSSCVIGLTQAHSLLTGHHLVSTSGPLPMLGSLPGVLSPCFSCHLGDAQESLPWGPPLTSIQQKRLPLPHPAESPSFLMQVSLFLSCAVTPITCPPLEGELCDGRPASLAMCPTPSQGLVFRGHRAGHWWGEVRQAVPASPLQGEWALSMRAGKVTAHREMKLTFLPPTAQTADHSMATVFRSRMPGTM